MKKFVLFGLPLTGLLLVGLLFSASVLTYSRLSDEALIAEIHFQAEPQDGWRAFISDGRGCELTEVVIAGDQWRIDAEFLKWKPWANVLGLDAQYRLNRFQGRYEDVVNERQNDSPVWSLTVPTVFDVAALETALGPLNFLVDATYGSSVYQRIDPGLVYLVYRSQSGLVTRYRARREDVQVAEEGVLITVRRGCDEPQNAFTRLVLALNRWLT